MILNDLENLSTDFVKSLIMLEISSKRGLISNDILQKARESIIKSNIYEYGSVNNDDIIEVTINQEILKGKLSSLRDSKLVEENKLKEWINDSMTDILCKPLDIEYIEDNDLLDRKINIIFMVNDASKTENIELSIKDAQMLIKEKQLIFKQLINDLCVH